MVVFVLVIITITAWSVIFVALFPGALLIVGNHIVGNTIMPTHHSLPPAEPCPGIRMRAMEGNWTGTTTIPMDPTHHVDHLIFALPKFDLNQQMVTVWTGFATPGEHGKPYRGKWTCQVVFGPMDPETCAFAIRVQDNACLCRHVFDGMPGMLTGHCTDISPLSYHEEEDMMMLEITGTVLGVTTSLPYKLHRGNGLHQDLGK